MRSGMRVTVWETADKIQAQARDGGWMRDGGQEMADERWQTRYGRQDMVDKIQGMSEMVGKRWGR